MASSEAMKVLMEIGAERDRQVGLERHSREKDDHYQEGVLARAGAAYALAAGAPEYSREAIKSKSGPMTATAVELARIWPWAWQVFKLKDRRRDLVRGAALLVAEIERIDRASERGDLQRVGYDVERPSMIVYGDAATGKTSNALVIAEYFGLSVINDAWTFDADDYEIERVNVLFLTNQAPPAVWRSRYPGRCWSITEVMQRMQSEKRI